MRRNGYYTIIAVVALWKRNFVDAMYSVEQVMVLIHTSKFSTVSIYYPDSDLMI